jgi:hypothetical protein
MDLGATEKGFWEFPAGGSCLAEAQVSSGFLLGKKDGVQMAGWDAAPGLT